MEAYDSGSSDDSGRPFWNVIQMRSLLSAYWLIVTSSLYICILYIQKTTLHLLKNKNILFLLLRLTEFVKEGLV